MDSAQDAAQQSNAVSDRKKAYLLNDVFKPIEKENDSHQERKMVVASDHVLRAKIQERRNGPPSIGFDETGVALRDVVRAGAAYKQDEG